MFLGEHASDVQEIVITDQMDAVQILHVVAIFGDLIVDVSVWDCSKNGENKAAAATTIINNFDDFHFLFCKFALWFMLDATF